MAPKQNLKPTIEKTRRDLHRLRTIENAYRTAHKEDTKLTGRWLELIEYHFNTTLSAITKPVADNRWWGSLSFNDYRNVDRVKDEVCYVAAVFAYLVKEKGRLRDNVIRISGESGTFQEFYETKYKEQTDLPHRWLEFVECHFDTISTQTEEWFDDKFEELLRNEPQ